MGEIFIMGEILPDGSIQGYQSYCQKCGVVINVNAQGDEIGDLFSKHICLNTPKNYSEKFMKIESQSIGLDLVEVKNNYKQVTKEELDEIDRERNKRGKLVKITFEYENLFSSLVDDEAREWNDDVNGMCVFLQNRGMNPFEHKDYNWIEEIKELDDNDG